MENKILRLFLVALLIAFQAPIAIGQGRVAGEVFMTHSADITTGVIFFVDVSGSDEGGTEGSPAFPFATLDYTVGRCGTAPAAASTGCTIYLMPGHAETLSVADAVDVDVAGVSVVGLGTANLRPTFTMATNAAAEYNVDAANHYLANVVFIANVATTALIELTANADGFHMDNVLVREGSAEPAIMLDMVGQADDVLIENSTFLVPTAGAGATGIDLSALTPARFTFRNNTLRGDFNVAAIHGTGAATDILIENNVIENALAGQYALELTAAALGVIKDNFLISSTAITVLDPGSTNVSGNTWSNGIDNEAGPIPESAVFYPGYGYRVTATGTSLAADDNVFTITGLVMITSWVLHVTTVFSGATTDLGFDTDGGTIVAASAVVDDYADESIIVIHGDQSIVFGLALTPEVEVGHYPDNMPWSNLFVGGAAAATTIIVSDSGSGDTGIYDSYITYIPITVGATMVASP